MTCRRFKEEGLRAIEAGETLDPHFATCGDCVNARITCDRLRAALTRVGEHYELPGDFEARVWAAVARETPARRRWWWIGSLLTVATAALFLLIRPDAPGGLPPYRVRVSSGELPVRTPQVTEVLVLAPSSRLHLTFQPDAAVQGGLAVRAWLRTDDGLRPVMADTKISETGSVRVEIRAADLGPGAGPREVLVVIGRPDALPGADALESPPQGQEPPWRLFRQPVDLRGP